MSKGNTIVKSVAFSKKTQWIVDEITARVKRDHQTTARVIRDLIVKGIGDEKIASDFLPPEWFVRGCAKDYYAHLPLDVRRKLQKFGYEDSAFDGGREPTATIDEDNSPF